MSGSEACFPTAAIILAAGAATRMGRLKQLLPFRGRTLVENAVLQALAADLQPVVVVVGAESEAVRNSIAHQPVTIVENSEWQSGMGSSIACGMQLVKTLDPKPAAVAILLTDQPLVAGEHLTEMRRLLHTTACKAVAAQYQSTLGVPALFKRELWDVLASLPSDAGARWLLRNSGEEITAFPLTEAAIDLDTPEDFAQLAHARELNLK